MSMPSVQSAGKYLDVRNHSPKVVSEVDPVADLADRSARVRVHGSYKCRNENRSGRLLVTSIGVNFEPAVAVKGQWEMKYDDIHRVEKVSISDHIFMILVLSLTEVLFSKDQSNDQSRLRSRYFVRGWTRSIVLDNQREVEK